MKEQEPKTKVRIKKVKGHGAHHGGAWKVAYADFVTAMMALFLVLWLVSQADTKLKQSIASYFRSPGVFSSMKGGILSGPSKVSKEPASLNSKDEEQALYSTAAMLRGKFSQRPQFSSYKDQVKIDVTPEGLKVQILDKADKVSFPSGSADMGAEPAAILTEIAHGICALPNPILIGGHTDHHVFPAGSTYTNWELSTDRANAARRVLEAGCVKSDQIQRIIGYADTDLLVPEDPYAPSNRRITIVVMRTEPLPPQKDDEAEDQDKPTRKIVEPAVPGPQSTPAEPKAGEPANKSQAKPVPGKPVQSAETRAQQSKLESEGSVKVGQPDRIPEGARRTREVIPRKPGN